jgi:hypothetical protein
MDRGRIKEIAVTAAAEQKPPYFTSQAEFEPHGWVYVAIERAIAEDRALRAAQVNPAVDAIKFALSADEGLTWLRLWNEGEFERSRFEWPESPEACYIGADPLHPETKRILDEQQNARQAMGEAIAEYFGQIDNDARDILHAFDYCDARNIDDFIDTCVPRIARDDVGDESHHSHLNGGDL